MKIHFIAIGGSIMHSLAIELKKNGHFVTGSDDVIYEPSKSNLIKHKILPKKYGWYTENIHSNLDLVILGMHAKKNNPELLEAQKLSIPIMSFPKFISNYAKDKKRIVISGSHGKTTITSMIIHVLNHNKVSCDYLVGAQLDGIINQVNLNNNNIIIIEGDEYWSSAIDLTPKFMHYDANMLVVSGVSWDHINVFPTKTSYENAFRLLLNKSINNADKIFYCQSDNFLSNFSSEKAKNMTSYNLPNYEIKNGQTFVLYKNQTHPLNIFGKHNLYNLEAARSVCLELGISNNAFYNAMQSFKGARRRLNIIKTSNDSGTIYYDFAHSPSKVLATINAVKDLNPERYLIACLELHTYSSLSINFLPNYNNVVTNCDEFWLYLDADELKRKGLPDISSEFLISCFNHSNMSIVFDKKILRSKILDVNLSNTNLLLMSSGSFSGLNIDELVAQN